MGQNIKKVNLKDIAKNTLGQNIKNFISDTTKIDNYELMRYDEGTDGKGSSKDMTQIKLPENDWIFGKKALETGQFGGNQNALYEQADRFIKDPKIKDIISKYYPNVTNKQMEALFQVMEKHGCGYIASINTIMYQYLFHDEGDFQKRFGFPPYDLVFDENGKMIKDYNFEYLFLDFFLYHCKNYKGFKTIDEVLTKADGVSNLNEAYTISLKKYLSDKGIKINVLNGIPMTEEDKKKAIDEWKAGIKDNANDLKWVYDLTSDIVKEYLGKGDNILVSGLNGFDLYYPYDKDGNGKLDDVAQENLVSHEMMVVGTTSDPNKIVVSSWGEECVMDISNVSTHYVVIEYPDLNEWPK